MNRGATTKTPTHPATHLPVAQDAARLALFSAASRVLRYHADALDQKVERYNRTIGQVPPRSPDESRA